MAGWVGAVTWDTVCRFGVSSPFRTHHERLDDDDSVHPLPPRVWTSDRGKKLGRQNPVCGVRRAKLVGENAIKIARGQQDTKCGLEAHRDRNVPDVGGETPELLSIASKDFGQRLFVSNAELIQGMNAVAELAAGCISRITSYTGTYSSAIKASPGGSLSGLRRGT